MKILECFAARRVRTFRNRVLVHPPPRFGCGGGDGRFVRGRRGVWEGGRGVGDLVMEAKEQDWKASLIHVCVFVHNTRKRHRQCPKKWKWRCLSLQTIQCFLSTWWSKWQWVQDYCKLDTTRNPNSLFFSKGVDQEILPCRPMGVESESIYWN